MANNIKTLIVAKREKDTLDIIGNIEKATDFISSTEPIFIEDLKALKNIIGGFSQNTQFRLLIHPKLKGHFNESDLEDCEISINSIRSIDGCSHIIPQFITRSDKVKLKCIEEKKYFVTFKNYEFCFASFSNGSPSIPNSNYQTFINSIKIFTKNSINETNRGDLSIKSFEYAIFTALYDDEFEEVEKLFDWHDEMNIETETTIYKVGKLKGSDKLVVANFANKTGMIEASVIATEMIHLFNPEYILMPGVCGGSSKTEFGDIIIAEKVFTIQQGKISDLVEGDVMNVKKAKLHYRGSELNLNEISDSYGNKINVLLEEYENELNVIETDSKLISKIKPQLKKIKDKINDPYKIEEEKIKKIEFAPMACSIMVINKSDYFDINIKDKERKTKAVEMESYGIARASKFANGGRTKFLIFKSVMDKTNDKNDKYKSKAAYVSAQFLRYLLEDNII